MTDNNAVPLEIDDETRAVISGAFESGNYFTVAYNGDDGWPRVSRRGSTQAFGPQQLAIWVRKRDEGLTKAIASRPELTLFYLNIAGHQLYTFFGRGEVSTDPEINRLVYENAPEREQAQDPDRAGIAVIVELDRIEARGARSFVMQRDSHRGA